MNVTYPQRLYFRHSSILSRKYAKDRNQFLFRDSALSHSLKASIRIGIPSWDDE